MPTEQPSESSAPAESPEKAKRRRRWRVLITAAVMVGALWAVLTHSPLTRALVVPRIERALGATIEGGSVSVGLDGTLTIRDAAIRAPGVDGKAGAVVEVKRLRVHSRLSSLIGKGAKGELPVSLVELDEPLVRFSQSVDDGSINISAMRLPESKGGPTALPPVVFRRGVIELGEHGKRDDGKIEYTVLKRLELNGTVNPSPSNVPGEYDIAVGQLPGAQPTDASRLLDLRGTIGSGHIALSMAGLSLADFPPSSVPRRLRGLFEFLALEGNIRRTTFDYDERLGVRASIELAGVAVNLPIESTEVPLEGPVRPEPPLRMRAVNGSIRFDTDTVTANLDGLLEDLPYKVALTWAGVSVDAPFVCDLECSNFEMQERPQILRFAPPLVKYYLAQFSNPTGLVSTRARVTRGQPQNGLPAPLKISGTMEFERATAAYDRFRYRFYNLKGRAKFDDNSLEVISLSGDHPTGATITASAKIAPLTDDAGVDVQVRATGVPIDATLIEAMGPGRRKFVDELLSTEQYKKLLAQGVVRDPSRDGELREQIEAARADGNSAAVADLERRLGAPVLPFGGKGDVSISVLRQEGSGSIWDQIIDVRLGTLGLVPARFPLPIVADGARIVIDGETIKVGGGEFRGLTGGSARVEASMRYPSIEQPDLDPLPQVRVSATGIPVDPRLIAAVRGAVERVSAGKGENRAEDQGPWIEGVLRSLGLAGTIDAETEISSSEQGTVVQTVATPRDVTVMPVGAPAGAGPVLEKMTGTIVVTDDRISMDLLGDLAGVPDAGHARLRSDVNISEKDADEVGPPVAPGWSAVVALSGAETSIELEHVASVFSAKAGAKLGELRSRHRPSGKLDALIVQSGGAEKPFLAVAELSNAQGFRADIFGTRVGIENTLGSAVVSATDGQEPLRVRFDGIDAELTCGDMPGGRLRLDGPWVFAEDGRPAEGTRIELNLTDARFESPFTRAVILDRGSDAVRELAEKFKPRGSYDCAMELRPARGAEAERSEWTFNASLAPRSLSVRFDRGVAFWPNVQGEIHFQPTSGVFDDLSLSAPVGADGTGWDAVTSGSWLVETSGDTTVQSRTRFRTSGMPQGLMVIMPDPVAEALGNLNFRVDGSVASPNLQVTIRHDQRGQTIDAEGTIELDNASLEAGVPITSAAGKFDFKALSEPSKPAEFSLWVLLERFRLANILMTGGRLRMASGDREGEILVPVISADCYGGRLSGRARSDTVDGDVRGYESSFQLSGVRFANVLRDLTNPEFVGPPTPDEINFDMDESRGKLDANIALAGRVNDVASRRGRGSAIVGGGAVVEVPLLLPLVQFSNLQLPTDERLSLATADFFVDGPVVCFEDLSVFSESVRLMGYGTVTWPEMACDLRFNSRSLNRVPLVSWLIESVRDEIISTRVSGTVKQPSVETAPLSGAAELIAGLLGTKQAPEQLRMLQMQKRAIRAPDRARTSGWKSGEAP